MKDTTLSKSGMLLLFGLGISNLGDFYLYA